MKPLITLTILFSLSVGVKAGFQTDYPEITDTVLELGIDLDEFSTLWPFYCNPKWSKTMPAEQAEDVKFVRSILSKNFLSSEIADNKITLSQGETCKALLEYYFEGKESEILASFIEEDKNIIKKYGFTSIDLFQFPANYQGTFVATDPSPGHAELTLKLIERFRTKNIFTIVETQKGNYYVTPSKQFLDSHLKLQGSNSAEP